MPTPPSRRRRARARANPEVDIDPGVVREVIRELVAAHENHGPLGQALSARQIAQRLHPALLTMQQSERPTYMDNSVFRHLLFLHEHGMLDWFGVGLTGDWPRWTTKWLITEDVIAKSPKWPKLVLDEKEGNDLLRSPRLHDLLRMLTSDAWQMHWEFPGYLGIGTPASLITIGAAADTEYTLFRPWGGAETMLNVFALDAKGDRLANEQGLYVPWPETSIEACAILLAFMIKYHP